MGSAWSACASEAADVATKPGTSHFRRVCRTLLGSAVQSKIVPKQESRSYKQHGLGMLDQPSPKVAQNVDDDSLCRPP
jgi:hypothetical protein